ncbi:phosphoribosyl-ATP diphosphatase [Vagococcus acidifermentans]|uniref:Phosphoribosyl-ATP pyrophosphatase n=1 Tax=Vagococcus acidifermentans TaxID=564710 RepID=A0A430ANE3_9ENTE|nr:phosphoribosyl-ATP diphosphatase [Vagococcus acidifermentans]RSU09638.1 phosphoribosyl-ATP diphosphatase [Vagococcus acidifermentans]
MIESLYEKIRQRKITPQSGSYTNYLFDEGLDKILKKVGEEATEVVIAAKNDDEEELISEMADLTYHCLVLLAEKDISLEKLQAELEKREGKISRTDGRRDINLL